LTSDDTLRSGDYWCFALEADQLPDTGDSYDGSKYINFDYQFTQDTAYMIQTNYPCTDPRDTCPDDTIYRDVPRPGYAGFKTAWDYGMNGFPLARYKYLILAHKGPPSAHRVTVRGWYNDGGCGSPSFNEYLGTFASSDTWREDTIVIPDSVQNKSDRERNFSKYYELVFIINNLDPNDTTSGPPGCLKVDNIRLAGCNPIDTSPKPQEVKEGEAATFNVWTSRVDSADVLTFQWQKDGADIAGANGPAYALASVTAGDAGVYTVAVTVSSTGLSFTSLGAALTVGAKEEEKEGCGCGSGTGTALIPPLIFKAMAHRRRKNTKTGKKT
jgi:hypothetical protein